MTLIFDDFLKILIGKKRRKRGRVSSSIRKINERVMRFVRHDGTRFKREKKIYRIGDTPIYL